MEASCESFVPSWGVGDVFAVDIFAFVDVCHIVEHGHQLTDEFAGWGVSEPCGDIVFKPCDGVGVAGVEVVEVLAVVGRFFFFFFIVWSMGLLDEDSCSG